MNTSEFVKAIATKSGITQKTIKEVLSATTDVICENISNNEPVKALGVMFSTKVVDEHNGRNPQTGETIVIPARRKVVLKASKTLKDAVALD